MPIAHKLLITSQLATWPIKAKPAGHQGNNIGMHICLSLLNHRALAFNESYRPDFMNSLSFQKCSSMAVKVWVPKTPAWSD